MQRDFTREQSVLDLYITNRPSLVKSISNVPNISDHEAAIIVDSNIRPVFIKSKPRSYHLFSKADWTKMKEDINSFSPKFLNSVNDKSVNENWTEIKTVIQNTIKKHVPERKPRPQKQHPWISTSIKRKCRKKHRLYKKALKSKDSSHFTQFKAYKKTVDREVKKAKNDYINNEVLGGLEGGNTKPFFRFVKTLRNDNLGLAPLKSGTNLVTDSQQKAKMLLSEFSSVFTKEDKNSIPWLGPSSSLINDINVTTEGVEKLLSGLKTQKAAGPDRIPNRVLKELSHELAPAFTALYNQSLTTGTIPTDWANAIVTPVYKKGSAQNPANYRPVSLTCVACKLLEHIVCTNILSHLEDHKLLTSVQHGFRKNHSCETQLLITVDDFFSSFDAKIQTDVGVLDFSRAFDTVPHERLIGKLAHYGIRGSINKWIRAFLSDRQMCVVVDGESSSSAPVLSGVPQGSVLGPLLFLLFINDMPDVVSQGTLIRLFADDCLVYREIHSPEDQIILQRDLDNLTQWATRWGMRFNPSKCQILHISRTKPVTKFYTMCGEILATVNSAKYLGVIISSDLQWREQIQSSAKKANSTLHLVARNLRSCSRFSRALAYTTLVRPKLEYCCSVWDPYKEKDIADLEMVNRRAARTAYNRSWRQQDVSPTSLLRDLGWKTLAERREEKRLCLLYKIAGGLVAVPPTRLQSPSRTTRGHSRKFRTIQTNIESVKNSFYPRTIPSWNSLKSEIVEARTYESFKSQLQA